MGIRAVAETMRENLGAQYPVIHVDTPFALQFCLNTATPLTSFDEAAVMLQGEKPVVVAVSDFNRLAIHLPTNQSVLHELTRWPSNGTPKVRVVSNRPFATSSARLAAEARSVAR
jgi:hypothetical protein